MASDYASISRYNEEQLGKDRASRMTQVAMYADTAHFIYELLQNADDVDADEISFAIYSDQLVVEHNGAPFNEKNVKSISYFGKGKTDITKIGHFGLGFKSVFAYTASPRIHSGSESFEITDLYSIAPFPNPNDLDQAWTRFVLPFDHHIKKPNYIEHRKLKSPTDAQNEITEKLCKLGADALLFTKSLRTINIKSDGVSIYCRRTDCRIDDAVREVVIATTDTPTQCFLVFDRSVFWADDRGDKKEYRPVQIAYGLTKPLADGGAIKRLVGTHLHVFFPTDKETHHGIILQGPYRTTPARDNLPEDDDFNKHLVSETAPLLAQSLHRLKTLNLLGLDALAALPLDHERFLPGTFFHPLHTCVRHELTTKQLLPTAEGGYTSGSNGKLASVADLTQAFSSQQLQQLFSVPGLQWIDPKVSVSSSNYSEIYRLLVGKAKSGSYGAQTEWVAPPLAPEIRVGHDEISKRISADFMSLQTPEWLISFFDFLAGVGPAARDDYLARPILPLENGAWVPANPEEVYLPPENRSSIDLTRFSIVKQSLLESKSVLAFLKTQAGLHEPDFVDAVIRYLLPKFASGCLPFDETTYSKDLQTIATACREDRQGRMLPALNALPFVACVPAWLRETDAVVWKAPASSTVFARTSNLEIWFAGNDQDKPLFLHASVEKALGRGACGLQFSQDSLLVGCDPFNRGKVRLSSRWGDHKQGLDGFNPSAGIFGLGFALDHWSKDRAAFLWSVLLGAPHLIKGETQEETAESRLDGARRKPAVSKLGQACIESSWLPDRDGRLHRPKDLVLSDLHGDFDATSFPAREVIEKLGIKLPAQMDALAQLGKGNPARTALLEKIASATDEELAQLAIAFPQEIPPKPAPPFKEAWKHLSRPQRGAIHQGIPSPGPLSNSARYMGGLKDEVTDAVTEHLSTPHTVTFSVVRDHPSNEAARRFLYEQYQGRCQVTGQTFPKAAANADGNAENYFEACALLSYSNASYLNDPGNMLCVSADTMAKLKYASCEWLDDVDEIIRRFNDRDSGGTATARLLLAGEEVQITWSERHFLHFVALWEKA